MENNHSPRLLLLLLLVLLTMLTTTAHTTAATNPAPLVSPLPPATATQQLNNIIDALIGAGDFSSWVSIITTANPTVLAVSATLFIPQDNTLDQPLVDPFLFPYHVVPQRLTFSDLLLFPLNSRLPTLLPGKSISVTDNSTSNFSLNATPLTHPDLYSTASVAVHGVKSVLDYSSISGDPILQSPPSTSPPFMPVGDTIGSIGWNTSNGNCLGFMLDFCPVLIFFIVKDLFVFGTFESSLSWDEYCSVLCWCSTKSLLCVFAFNVLSQIIGKFR